jgi:hypothetical protein
MTEAIIVRMPTAAPNALYLTRVEREERDTVTETGQQLPTAEGTLRTNSIPDSAGQRHSTAPNPVFPSNTYMRLTVPTV